MAKDLKELLASQESRAKSVISDALTKTRGQIPALTPNMTRAELDAWLEKWKDELWVFWRSLFHHPGLATDNLPPECQAQTEEQGAAIATRLIEALRTRPVSPRKPPALDNRDGWCRWLIGKRAIDGRAAAQLRAERVAPDAGLAERDREAADDAIDELVVEFARAVERVVSDTQRPIIRWDWLWATCSARKPVAAYLRDGGRDRHDWTVPKRELIVQTSSPGEASSERIRRTRAGAAAAFRVNAAFFQRVHSSQIEPPFVGVFLGPTADEPPYRPRKVVTRDGYAYFVSVLTCSSLPARMPGAGAILACALQKEVARLLPKNLEDELRRDWEHLTGGGQ